LRPTWPRRTSASFERTPTARSRRRCSVPISSTWRWLTAPTRGCPRAAGRCCRSWPDGVTAADFAPALAAGVTRAAILEALNVGYLFNIITRLADAFEFHVGPPAAFASAAKRLLGHGYK